MYRLVQIWNFVMRVRTTVKRDEIVATAAEVFREFGFERASMSEIAARVGGSKATLYGYFGSKEELFLSVADAEGIAYFTPIMDQLHGCDDVRAALRGFGAKFLSFILQPHVLAGQRMVLAVAGNSDIGCTFYERGPKMGLGMLASFLDESIANGTLRRGDAMVMARHLVALLEAELVPEHLFGVRTKMPKDSVIEAAVRRAVDVFLAAYEVPKRTDVV